MIALIVTLDTAELPLLRQVKFTVVDETPLVKDAFENDKVSLPRIRTISSG